MTNNLSGWTVLVTRPAHQAKAICERIAQLGGDYITLPTIEILPPSDIEDFNATLMQHHYYDLSIFTSQNAASSVLNRMQELALQLQGEVAAVGAATAVRLSQVVGGKLIKPVGQEFTSEGLLAALNKRDMTGIKIVIYRAQSGREWLKEMLQQRGAKVDYVQAYRRKALTDTISAKTRQQIVSSVKLVSLCASAEAANNLFKRLDKNSKKLIELSPLIVPSERAKHGLEGYSGSVIVAESAMDDSMLAAIPST